MAQVLGVTGLVAKLQKKLAQSRKESNVSVSVGYTASYAIYVHENMEAHHPVGQAKFLEEPTRLLGAELGSIVSAALKKGKTMSEGLLLAGLRLQRESQILCPVDTGTLKNSAFTSLDPVPQTEGAV